MARKFPSAKRTLPGRIVSWWFGIGLLPLLAAPVPRAYTVDNYDVSIRPDLVKQHLDGEMSIRFHSLVETPVSALELDAGSLQIASVKEGSSPQWVERRGSVLFIVLTSPLYPGENRTLTVRYEAGSSAGLKFFPDQVYTLGTSDWMPCDDRPEERSTLHLTITAPADLQAAASGHLISTRANGPQSITEWRLDTPAAPAWFGFVLGALAENRSEADGVKLRVLGAVREVFDPTAAALNYLASRSGKSYPDQSYTQAFLHGDVVRCFAGGLTFLPESASQELAKEPDHLWLLTRTLAQQWYGIKIPLKDWSDLWLSEGLSAFLADSFLGQRLGQQSYEHQIEHSREIYNQLRVQDKDRALSDSGWTTREDAEGQIPIDKGACFLDLLYELSGDRAFWERLQWYTSEYWGQPVTSDDFQKAFAGLNGTIPSGGKKKVLAKTQNGSKAKAVEALFDVWVYGISSKPAGKKGAK